MGLDVAWTPGEHLMAHVVDVLNGANWQRGQGKGAKPKPIPRPPELHAKAQAAERHAERAQRFLDRQRHRELERGDS